MSDQAQQRQVEEIVRETPDTQVKLRWAGSQFQSILRDAVILIAILAWNTLFTKTLEEFIPKRKGKRNLFAFFIYAAAVTVLVLLLLLYTPI
jgi:hypothetical protein